MNQISKYITSSIVASLLLGLISCTDGFRELNTDPTTPPYIHKPEEPKPQPEPEEPSEGDYQSIALAKQISEEAMQALKESEGTIGASFRSLTYQGLVDDYQRTTNLTHDIYAGYFAHNNPNFSANSPVYVYTADWSDRRWNHFYQERTSEYQTVAKVAYYIDKEKYHNAFYMARVYYAFLLSTMTDTYGDIPVTPMIKCQPAPTHATYQPQSEVYDKIFLLLEEASKQLDPARTGFVFDKRDDRCFEGDVAKWQRFTNTLRLRLALRISNVDPVRAKKEGEAALAHPAGLMKSQEDRMRTVPKYAPVELGGDDDSGSENEVANCSYRYLDAVMSKDLELAYYNLSADIDPRCPISWFRPTPKRFLDQGVDNPNMKFTGSEIGNMNVDRTPDKYSVLRVMHKEGKKLSDTHWFSYSREFIWFGYAECKFLQAEAALRGWANAGGSAEQLYLEGIRESMRYYHLPEDKTEAYIAGLKNNPFDGGDREAQLEAIITQKWLAVFPNGNEAWAEYRRTDYPRLRNPLNNLSADVPVGKFIKRVSYPISDIVNNENAPKDAKQGDRVWWDVADTNGAPNERAIPNNFR